MKNKKVVSKCCEAPIILMPKGLVSVKESFLCTKCNKVCEIKSEDGKNG